MLYFVIKLNWKIHFIGFIIEVGFVGYHFHFLKIFVVKVHFSFIPNLPSFNFRQMIRDDCM